MKYTSRKLFIDRLIAFCALGALLPLGMLWAHEPIVTINRLGGMDLGPGAVISVPYFPYPFDIEGTVTHEGKGNLNTVTLSAFINDESIYGPVRLTGNGNETTTNYLVPWTIPAPNYYEIAVVATHFVKGTPERCKAAPALAAAHVREHPELFAPGAIAVIGKETGINGLVSAQRKCEVEYHVEVYSLLTEE